MTKELFRGSSLAFSTVLCGIDEKARIAILTALRDCAGHGLWVSTYVLNKLIAGEQ